jgi:hypothetical protein
LERCRRFVPDAELEGYRTEERRLEEEERGDDAMKFGRSTTEEEDICRHVEKLCLTNNAEC